MRDWRGRSRPRTTRAQRIGLGGACVLSLLVCVSYWVLGDRDGFAQTTLAQTTVAQTGEQRALTTRIERLERDLRDLQRDYYSSGAQPAPMAPSGTPLAAAGETNLALRMDALEAALRSLTGQVEELNFRLNQLHGRVSTVEQQAGIAQTGVVATDGVVGQQEFGTTADPFGGEQAFSGALSSGPSGQMGDQGVAGPSSAPGTLGTLSVPEGGSADPNAQFSAAMEVLYRGDYESGALALQSYVTQHPNSGKTGEAYYWLGEAHLAQKAYREAAQAFLTAVQKYPKDPKAPQALVKLGVTLIAGGQKSEGCGQLNAVREVFPKASQSVLDLARREQQKAGCN